MKTSAAVLHKAHTALVVEEIELAPLKSEDVLVSITACGVCHSDLHIVNGQPGRPFPLVLGHEAAGIVQEAGESVATVKPGDHVVLSFHPYCGKCRECASARTYRCTLRKGPPGYAWDGAVRMTLRGQPLYQMTPVPGFARHAIVHQSSAIKVADDVPLDKACLIGCAVATGIGAALNTADVQPGSSVVVIGCGGIGLNVVQGARLAGAATIIAVDTMVHKLALATQFGATAVINASSENVVKRVRELTGRGADYAFEAIGRPETIQQAYDCIGMGGKAVVAGIVPDYSARLQIAPGTLLGERTLTGTMTGSTRPIRDFPRYVQLYREGRIKLDELITTYAPLERVNEALRSLERGEGARTVLLMQ